MNILLDECVPWPLRKLLADHTCQTAQQMGWKSVKNGELLTSELFDATNNLGFGIGFHLAPENGPN